MNYQLNRIQWMERISVILLASMPLLVAGQSANFKFSPEAVEVYEGEIFETQVIIETGNVPISVFDLHLAFDDTFLQVVEVEMLSEGSFSYHLPAEFSNNDGKLDLAAFHIGADVSEDFVVANITFIAGSPTELTQVSHPMDVFPKSVIAYGGEDVTGERGNLDVTITGSPLSDGIGDKDGVQIGIWPNPAGDLTKLSFELKESNQISLRLYSTEGKLVKTIFEGNALAGIPYQYEINVSDLAQGNYTTRLVAGDASFSNKLTVTR